MSADKLHRLQRGVVDLSVFVHTEVSNLAPDDSMETGMELGQVLELDPVDALLQVKKVVADLLKFKRDVMLTREYDDFKTMQQYQSALQKLESEVRNHIKIEQQLKLHIENTQSHMEDLEREHAETLDKMHFSMGKPDTHDSVASRDTGKRDDKNKLLQEIMQLRHSAKKDQQRSADLEKRIGKLEAEAILQKSALTEKQRECDKLQKDLQKTKVLAARQKENVASTTELRPSSSKKAIPGSCTEPSKEETRSISPLLLTSQSKMRSTQRCASLERLKSANRPGSAVRKATKAGA